MLNANTELVLEAASRNVAAVLTLPSAGMLRNHKSRFISRIEEGILFQAPAEDRGLIHELWKTASPCLVTFKHGIYKVNFASRILRHELEWPLNDTVMVPAILASFPEKIISTQRRANYRVEIPENGNLTVRVWRMAPGERLEDRPVRERQVTAQIRDLSVGGVGVSLSGRNGAPPTICEEDRLRVELNFAGEKMLIEGAMRTPAGPPIAGTLHTGIKFRHLEDSLSGRRTHTRLVAIVGEFQRLEIKAARLSLMCASV
jgi:c-di-GMP-binding flagellar brake protein YcgR